MKPENVTHKLLLCNNIFGGHLDISDKGKNIFTTMNGITVTIESGTMEFMFLIT